MLLVYNSICPVCNCKFNSFNLTSLDRLITIHMTNHSPTREVYMVDVSYDSSASDDSDDSDDDE